MSKKLIVPIMLSFVLLLTACQPERGNQSVPNEASAWYAAQHFVRQLLKCPATADFGDQRWESCVVASGSNRYRVSGWVDAQNGFGALVRTTFTCIVLDEGVEMSCLSISIEP